MPALRILTGARLCRLSLTRTCPLSGSLPITASLKSEGRTDIAVTELRALAKHVCVKSVDPRIIGRILCGQPVLGSGRRLHIRSTNTTETVAQLVGTACCVYHLIPLVACGQEPGRTVRGLSCGIIGYSSLESGIGIGVVVGGITVVL